MTLTVQPIAEIVITATGLVVTQGPAQAHLSRADVASILVRQRLTGADVPIKGLTLTGEQITDLHRTLASTPRRFQWARHV